MILDFKMLSLWFVILYWWYNTLTGKNNWFLNVLVKSNFATPTPFGRVSGFVVWVCLSNYNHNSFLIHQASYPKGNQWYLMHIEVLGSIWKIGRYPIKVSEVLNIYKQDKFRAQLSWALEKFYNPGAWPHPLATDQINLNNLSWWSSKVNLYPNFF